jgi:hypothetical protein
MTVCLIDYLTFGLLIIKQIFALKGALKVNVSITIVYRYFFVAWAAKGVENNFDESFDVSEVCPQS